MNRELTQIKKWFTDQNWKPAPFQIDAWQSFSEGESGLIHVPTGSGKTFAALFGPLAKMMKESDRDGLRLLYLTPLRAVSKDIEKSILRPIQEMKLPFRVESRTGDTSSHRKTKQKRDPPQILITTPESLSLLLSYDSSKEFFKNLRGVIVDEWHELLGSKRGTQVELALARLRIFSPGLQTWALSATLKNLTEAAEIICGVGVHPKIISPTLSRPVLIETLVPENIADLPWAGHMGQTLLPQVLDKIDIKNSALFFTNTRSQAEKWYAALSTAKPEWENLIGLHHASVDRETRESVEAGLKDGNLKLVVATSSLDLGVDFSPVKQVFQVGSPKGVGRLMQRAGRSAHQPGQPCKIYCVPTHALEYVEIAAARAAIVDGEIEGRLPIRNALDVLCQHMVTCALGGGFTADALLNEVRTTAAYVNVTTDDFAWCLSLVEKGGQTLNGYTQYHKVEHVQGLYRVVNREVAHWHRLNIGTITSDAAIEVVFLKGKRLGTIEESFISKLKAGDKFAFAGRTVQYVRLRENKAYVQLAKNHKGAIIPQWQGGRLNFSTSLSHYVKVELERARSGRYDSPEMIAVKEILETQAELSHLPAQDECLVEFFKSREGHHLFIFPFEGRTVHEGLAALLSLRFSRQKSGTFSLAVNDYGLEILSSAPYPFEELLEKEIFTADGALLDIRDGLNLTELTRRQFREVARVSGLVIQNIPGHPKSAKQLQSSSGLIYDVFRRYEPGNLLLRQAQSEVLERNFEESRLARTLASLSEKSFNKVTLKKPSPLSFPLILERWGAILSNESLVERVKKMRALWLNPTSI